MYFPKITCLLFLVLIGGFGVLMAQTLPQDINETKTTEVSGTTMPASGSIFVAAMEGTPGVEETVVYRSTNGGAWTELFRLGPTAIYNRAPDPVIRNDGAGNLYLEMMRIPPLPFTSHIVLFLSTDQGQTWNMQSYPYYDMDFGDYPALTARPGGFVATSYSEYTMGPLDSWVEFRRSLDGGLTWTAPLRFDGNRSALGSNFITVGSDLCWVENRLCMSYGDYNFGQVYFTSSLDSGLTWTPVDTIPLTISDIFMVTKLIPWQASDTLFCIAHKPHDNQARIHLNTSYDGGQSWTSQVVATNAAYAEALQSGLGKFDLVYNETDAMGNFSIRYRWSDDAGQTIGAPVTLWTLAQNHQGAGEYQAFMPAASGNGFDLAFIDDGDSSKLKYLHFTHGLIPVGVEDAQLGYSIFPNPTHALLKIKVDELQSGPEKYRLCDLAGHLLLEGEITENLTKINLNDYAAGAYLLLLEQGNHIDVRRVVKE